MVDQPGEPDHGKCFVLGLKYATQSVSDSAKIAGDSGMPSSGATCQIEDMTFAMTYYASTFEQRAASKKHRVTSG